MGIIAEKIREINQEIKNSSASLVAISKTRPVEQLLEAYEAGQRDFGENKVQEMVTKSELLPKDIRWHMVGHLQRNKVKYIVPFVYLIHSVDSVRLLREINKEAQKSGRIISCLLQVHIAREQTKFGFDESELMAFLSGPELSQFQHIQVTGLMGMATFTEDTDQIRAEFTGLKKLFDTLATTFRFPNFHLTRLSMGMSDDYLIALDCGSTMIRVGSSIFGERQYG